MEESQFFRIVWRFNALIILCAGILAIGVLLFAGYTIMSEFTRDIDTRSVVNVDEASEVEEAWSFGSMADIDGSPYLMIPFNSDQAYDQSFSRKASLSVRNYLFIHSETSEQHWLFDTDAYLISNNVHLSEKTMAMEQNDVQAILYQVIKTDTNGDQRLNYIDLQTIGVSLPNGEGYTEIISEIDLLIGHRLINNDTLLILYQKNGTGYSLRVNLPDFTTIDETELMK
ncbi:MAG: hypothetical protein AAF639_27550 [Chloroflexota bacterium]